MTSYQNFVKTCPNATSGQLLLTIRHSTKEDSVNLCFPFDEWQYCQKEGGYLYLRETLIGRFYYYNDRLYTFSEDLWVHLPVSLLKTELMKLKEGKDFYIVSRLYFFHSY